MIKVNEKQAEVLGRWAAWDVQSEAEGANELNSGQDVLTFAGKIQPYVVMIEEALSTGEVTNVALAKQVAKTFMDDLEQTVGSESSRLRLIENEGVNWREHVGEKESKAEAIDRMKGYIRENTEEAALLREVWDAARDIERGEVRG